MRASLPEGARGCVLPSARGLCRLAPEAVEQPRPTLRGPVQTERSSEGHPNGVHGQQEWAAWSAGARDENGR